MKQLVAVLKSRGMTIAVGESCTGGMFGAAITDVPGSSEVFRGGIIAYANDVKADLLDVPPKLLPRGAVSAAVAEAMAHGAANRLNADVGVGITGSAGPGGSKVGTVWIAVCGPHDLVDVHRIKIKGPRDAVRAAAVATAREMALEALREDKAEQAQAP